MKGTIDSGTFVIVKPDQEYVLGDIIGFVNEDGRNVIHRIIEQTDEGFITKGDNNQRKDPDVIPLENVIGRSIFVAPFLGFTSMFLQTPLGMSIFGIWALILFMKNKPKKSKKDPYSSDVKSRRLCRCRPRRRGCGGYCGFAAGCSRWLETPPFDRQNLRRHRTRAADVRKKRRSRAGAPFLAQQGTAGRLATRSQNAATSQGWLARKSGPMYTFDYS